jgi:tRNA dimethylallyltransferase
VSAPAATSGTIVAIVGATATGKTEVGELVAAAIGGEVICADSRQVFRELEIGTGKPTPAERASRPHHLFDALGLGDAPSAGAYARLAAEAVARVRARGGVPVLVGGSGLWIRAAMRGLAPTPPHHPALRARLRRECEIQGPEALHARLAALDPATAARLEPRDRQRIVRALEVAEGSGTPLSAWHARPHAGGIPGAWRVVELRMEPRALGRRIEARTRWMFGHGLPEETAALVERGFEAALRRLGAVGYDEAIELVTGRIDRAEAERRATLRTRRLAKRQRTWFRHQIDAVPIEAGERSPASLAGAVGSLLRAPG